MASVALLLAPRFRKIYFAAGSTHRHLPPRGLHPLLDHLWSTEGTEFVHDGCEASRFGKLAAIASRRVGRRTLRVCWENRDSAYNCGRCEKCLRTMACLRALGVLDDYRTFPSSVDLRALAAIRLNPGPRDAFDDVLAHLTEHGRDPALAAVVRTVLTANA